MLCHEKPSNFSQPPPGLEDWQIGWFPIYNPFFKAWAKSSFPPVWMAIQTDFWTNQRTDQLEMAGLFFSLPAGHSIGTCRDLGLNRLQPVVNLWLPGAVTAVNSSL